MLRAYEGIAVDLIASNEHCLCMFWGCAHYQHLSSVHPHSFFFYIYCENSFSLSFPVNIPTDENECEKEQRTFNHDIIAQKKKLKIECIS